MAGPEKGMSCFLESLKDVNKHLELHSHDQEIQKNADEAVFSKRTNKDHILHSDELLSCKEISKKLPLKLPQAGQKYRLLGAPKSASSEQDLHTTYPAVDAAIQYDRRVSFFPKEDKQDMDLMVMEGDQTVELQLAMESARAEAPEKKKLLVHLEQINSTVHKNSRGLHGSSGSNPSRTCKFCGREFPSGRALGGHMRVHGALLDAQMSSVTMKQQKRQESGQHGSGIGTSTKVEPASMDPSVLRQQLQKETKASSSSTSEKITEGFDVLNERIRADYSANKKLDYETTDAESGRRVPDRRDVRCNLLGSFNYYDCPAEFPLTGKLEDFKLPAGAGEDAGDVAYIAGHAGTSLSSEIKKNPALYELRRNPKPNLRFIRGAAQITDPIWPPNGTNAQASDQLQPTPLAGGRRSLSTSPERAHPCSECGKVFASWKALFGHMRCHPEREWRGIQRPDSTIELNDRTLGSLMSGKRLSTEGLEEVSYVAPCMTRSNSSNAGKAEETTQNEEQEDEKQAGSKLPCPNIGSLLKVGGREQVTSTSDLLLVQEMKASMASLMDLKAGEDPKMGKANKINQCNINKTQGENLKSDVLHNEAMIGQVTDDWTPAWSNAGKRSKRRRLLNNLQLHQPALTSETTSNHEMRLDQNKTDQIIEDQDDLDMANCLVLLSNAGVSCMQDMQGGDKVYMESTEESAFSHPVREHSSRHGSKEADISGERALEDGDDAHDHDGYGAQNHGGRRNRSSIAPGRPPSGIKYQCSTCKKCFNSHQALGGHRASHRKMKGCFARMKNLAAEAHADQSSEENSEGESEHIKWKNMGNSGHEQVERPVMPSSADPSPKAPKKKFRGHECSICHRIFATGQALGGHKRCHWTGEKIGGADTVSVASSNNYMNSNHKQQPTSYVERADEWEPVNNGSITAPKKATKEDAIDLNLPAPLDEDDEVNGFDDAREEAFANRSSRPQIWHQKWGGAGGQVPQEVCSVPLL